jgi:aromatic ring-opening dioxygenase catalytic subunit (LigB family)
MAQIVLSVGTSHGPSIQTTPDQWARLGEKDTKDPRFDYQDLLRKAKPGLEKEITAEVQQKRHAAAHAALEKLTGMIVDAKLDALVVVSNPHRVRNRTNRPVFGVFRADTLPVTERGDGAADALTHFQPDAKSPPADLHDKPGQADLANHLIESLIEDDFDIACIDRLPDGEPLDDAFTFAYKWILKDADLPLVPFQLSRDLPNQATARRCFDLGTALRRAIDAWPTDARVGLVASGGLSHQVIDEELDRRVIDALVKGDSNALRNLPRDRLNASPGTPEILNWITVAAAMAPSTMTLVDYLPCYRSLAGTGHGLTFGYWQ